MHILHDNTLTQDNRDKFIYLAGQYNQRVKFYNVEELYAEKILEFNRLIPSIKNLPFTIGAMYRLLAPEIFFDDIEKIIYLDSDIIVNLDIKEIWKIELDDKIFATVPEMFNGVITEKNLLLCRKGYVKKEDYFNTGVLLMNLKILREKNNILVEGIKFVSENPRFAANLDQDILNYCFATQTLHLPMKFNCFVRDARIRSEKVIERRIYHYLSGTFGYGILLNISDPFNRLWLEYFIKTPWFDAETIGRLYDSFSQNQIELKDTMIKFSLALSGKTRAFITSREYFETTKTIFSVRSDEEIITIESDEITLQELVDAMNTVASRGKKVFIVMVPNFAFDTFKQFGFVYGENIFNGFDFLSEKYGVPTNSYPLIKAM